MGGYYNTDRGNKLMSVACLSLVLVTIVVPARVWVRLRVIRSFGPDDWAIVIATVSFLCSSFILVCFRRINWPMYRCLGTHSVSL